MQILLFRFSQRLSRYFYIVIVNSTNSIKSSNYCLECLVAGWGIVDYFEKDIPHVGLPINLIQTNVKFVDSETCALGT